MELDEMDRAELDRVLRDEQRVVLVDYWSPWCGPCRTMRPHLERLADEYRDDARVVAVNVEAQPDVSEQFDVATLPTLILYQDGQPVRRFTGPTLPGEIASAFDAVTRGASPEPG